MAENRIPLYVEPVADTDKFENQIVKAVSDAGKSIEKEFSQSSKSVDSAFKNYHAKINQLLTDSASVTTKDFKAVEKVGKSIKEFYAQYNEAQTLANTATDELTKEYEAAEKAYEAAKKERGELTAQRSELARIAKLRQEVLSTLGKETLEQRQARIEQEKEEQRQIIANQQRYMESRTANIRNRNKRASEGRLQDLIGKDTTIKGYITKIENAREKLEEITDADAQFTRSLTELNSKGFGIAQQGFENLNRAIESNSQAMDEAKRKTTELKENLSQVELDSGKWKLTGMDDSTVAGLREAWASVVAQAKALNGETKNLDVNVKKILSTVWNIVRTLGTGVIKGVQAAVHGVANAIKHIGDNYRQSHKYGRGFFDDTKRSLKDKIRLVLQLGFGLRSVFFLYRRLRSAAKEALGVMAQSIEEVNQQMSSLATNMNQLKASLGTMVQPILHVLVPAFEVLTDRIVNCMNWLAKLVATLTGQGYIYKATAHWIDYADSVGKAAKEVSNLLKIDELNILNQDKGSGSGTGLNTDNVDFEKEFVDEDSIFAKIKESWANMDFTEIGEILQDKISEMFKNLNDKITGPLRDFAIRFATSFATLINGYVADYISPNEAAIAFANFFNVLFEAADRFASKLHWGDVGKYIVNGINTFLTTYNWLANGQTIAKFINGIATTMYEMASNPNVWTNIGWAIVDSINGVISNLQWSTIFGAVTETVNGLISVFYTVISNTTMWLSIRDGIVSAIQAVANIDLATVGVTLATLGNSLAQLVYDVVSDSDTWKLLASHIGGGINAFARSYPWSLAGKRLTTLISKLLEYITAAIDSVDWFEVGRAVGNLIGSIDWAKVTFNFTKLAIAIVKAIGVAIITLPMSFSESLGQTIGDYISKSTAHISGDFSELEQDIDDARQKSVDAGKEYGKMSKEYVDANVEQQTALKNFADAKAASALQDSRFTDDAKKNITSQAQVVNDKYKEMIDAANNYAEVESKYADDTQTSIQKRTEAYQQWKESAKEFSNATVELANTEEEAYQKRSNSISASVEDLKRAYIESAQAAQEHATATGNYSNVTAETIGNLLANRIALWANKIKDFWDNATKDTKDSSEDMSTNVEQSSDRITTGITGSCETSIKKITEAGAKILSNVRSSKIPETMETTGKNSADAFITPFKEVPKKSTDIFTEASKAADKQKEFKSAGNINKEAYLAGQEDNFASRNTKFYQGILDDVRKVYGIIGTGPSQQFIQIGTSVKEGYLSTQNKDYETRVSMFYERLVTVVCSVFGTSKNGGYSSVFYNLGTALNNSFVQGMMSLVSKVQKLMDSLANAISSTISYLQYQVANVVSSVESAMDKVRSLKSAAADAYASAEAAIAKAEEAKKAAAKASSASSGSATTSVPKLATGAVIPPNHEFLAILGDQKSGTNVEAPLSTIEDAVRNVLSEMQLNLNLNVQGDPSRMFTVMQRESASFSKRTGRPAFT